MKKKIFALCMAFVLVIGATFGITLAWLTDDTEKITNTFTVGDVAISLHEIVNFGTEETKNAADIVSGFKIVPGTSQTKAPFVKVIEGSEDAYVFMLVYNDFEIESGVTCDLNTTDWTEVSYDNAAEHVKLYRYKEAVSANNPTNKLFNNVIYASTITSESIDGLENCTIKFKAYAIQATGTDMTLAGEATTQARAWAQTADNTWN